MKRLLWMCACACLSACALEAPGELVDEDTGLEIAAPGDVEATRGAEDDAAIWRSEAALAACHGTITCPAVGTPGNWSMLYCGSSRCISQTCQLHCPDCEIKRVREQPREQKREWRRSDGSIACIEYRPYVAYKTCTCDLT